MKTTKWEKEEARRKELERLKEKEKWKKEALKAAQNLRK